MVALVAAQERRLPLGRAFWYVPHGPVLDYADTRAADWLRAVTIGLREVGRTAHVIAAKLEPRIEADSPRCRSSPDCGPTRARSRSARRAWSSSPMTRR